MAAGAVSVNRRRKPLFYGRFEAQNRTHRIGGVYDEAIAVIANPHAALLHSGAGFLDIGSRKPDRMEMIAASRL